ncbi:hypothetical protein HPB47_023789, partial [Ixodes persulcatus]
NRLNAMELFNDCGFLACYCFTKAMAATLLKPLSLEGCENSRGLPVSSMLQTERCATHRLVHFLVRAADFDFVT